MSTPTIEQKKESLENLIASLIDNFVWDNDVTINDISLEQFPPIDAHNEVSHKINLELEES